MNNIQNSNVILCRNNMLLYRLEMSKFHLRSEPDKEGVFLFRAVIV
jgi:hypothetical protein